MRRYQTSPSARAAESTGIREHVRERRIVELVGVLRASPPVAGPKESAAKTATRSTAARVEPPRARRREMPESRTAAIAPPRG